MGEKEGGKIPVNSKNNHQGKSDKKRKTKLLAKGRFVQYKEWFQEVGGRRGFERSISDIEVREGCE